MPPAISLAEDEPAQTRIVVDNVITIEAFVRNDSERCERARKYLTELTSQQKGLRLVIYDVLKDGDQLRRLWDLARRAGYEKAGVPAVYCCRRLHMGFEDDKSTDPQITDLFTMHVYTRSTCHRCAQAKEYLEQLQRRWPGLRVKIYEIAADAEARSRLSSLTRRFRVTPGLPSIHFAGRLLVGYQGDSVSGAEIESLLNDANPQPEKRAQREHPRKSAFVSRQFIVIAAALFSQNPGGDTPVEDTDDVPLPDSTDSIPLPEITDGIPQPVEIGDVPQPNIVTDPSAGTASDNAPGGGKPRSANDSIEVPVFGELRSGSLGMPAFTFLVGLVDGFNPCAMWVLVFLLSVLVNVKDRRKMIAIAGAFVVISGLAYFTFMAAWLNIFVLIGIARPVQIGLGCMAVFIGSVNVKDFFALKKGLSFSIPESQKPGIYERVRKIVSAKYLSTALWGAAALAIVVNIVELLCTAGLPALYSQILLMQELPAWLNYCYLGLYNVAYMLDDSILLTVVVVTLSHRRLQEREGRWLKLISGVAILVLGVTMIFKPEWLQLSA